jgi:hypothetical protein
MSIHFHETTTATPEQFVSALTDFGPDRSTLFPNSQDQNLQVHELGTDEADVTEGTGPIWERLHYDWHDAKRIEVAVTDSNVWGGDSGYTYSLQRRPDGATDVDVDIVREGKNLKGRVLGAVIGTVGKRSLGKGFAETVKAIEARSEQQEAVTV